MKKVIIISAAIISLIALTSLFLLKNNKLPTPLKAPTYEAGSPHYGPFIQTKLLKVSYNDKLDLALASITKEQAKRMKQYQQVILYDNDDNILPYGGKVSLVRPHNEGADLVITLPKNTNTSFLKESVSIITLRTITSSRLPISVLQKDDSGQPYIWIASKKASEPADENRYNIRRQYLDFILENDDLIAINSQKIKTRDLIIFNPDSALKSDQTILLDIIDFKATLHDPIRQAWIDADIEKMIALKEKMTQKIEECERRKNDPNYQPESPPARGDYSTADGPQQSSCGVTEDLPEIFRIFGNINQEPL